MAVKIYAALWQVKRVRINQSPHSLHIGLFDFSHFAFIKELEKSGFILQFFVHLILL